MAEFIACRNCDSPNCRGCNVYILEQALKNGRLDGLKGDNNTIRIPADVRPVVRGKWIPHSKVEPPVYHCSVCDGAALHAWGKQCKSDYCPNCGAEMKPNLDTTKGDNHD